MSTPSSKPPADTRTHLVLALALLVTLPSLTLGFVTDDYAFRALLRAPAPYGRPWYDLFRFASGRLAQNEHAIRTGHLPWWSAPDLQIHFVRPLTGALFAVDDALFGPRALFAHLHSVAWYLALVVAVAALYRRVLPRGPGVALALLVFAWSHAHLYAYAWLAARHVLVGALPAVIAVWAHVRWRDEAWRPGHWLAPLALAIGLAGSEVALAGAIFWVAFDLLGDRAHPPRARFIACAPAVLVTGAYLVLYRLVGGGVRASGGYHDPLGDSIGFVHVAVTRVPLLLGDALLGVPAELGNVVAPARLAVVGLGAVAVLAIGYAMCRAHVSDRERAALRWLVPAAVVATLLSATGFPTGRVLVLPDVGFAALLGVLLARGFESGKRRGVRVAIAVMLAAVHLLLAPLSSWRATSKLAHRARACESIARRLAEVAPPDGRVFLVASDPQVFLYPRGVLADTQPGVVRCASVLSAARAGHRITRMGDRTLVLEPLERTLLDGSFDTLFRGEERPFVVGDAVRQCGATVRVTRLRDGRPARLEVTFDRPLDAPDLVVLVWRDQRLERLEGLALGGSTEVPWSPGPTGL